MLRCRKNQSTLTAAEKQRFVNAMLALKAAGTYDTFVSQHLNNMPAAHRGPAFLPWHRVFLNKLELELQAVDPLVTLPYWDWTVDNSAASSIWNADFMGGNGRPLDGRVMDGPFAFDAGNWTLAFDGPDLRRRMGASPWAPTLPTPGDIVTLMAETVYDKSPWNDSGILDGFRNRLEGWLNGPQLHNRVHVWVGGSMGPASSPNDPVFFLNHCFVDKLWADWQLANPGLPYLPGSGGPAGHNLNDSMEPWASLGETLRPADTLDHHAMGYAYDTEGVCQPTLKVIDDLPTLKFSDDTLKPADDVVTIKLIDDPITLKFADDPQTLKFVDDPLTFKVVDDPQTLKTIDDPQTLKVVDDGATLKGLDDVKHAGLDKMPGSDMFDPRDPRIRPQGDPGTSPVPFILVNPHHSMAWTQTFPGSLESKLQELRAEISRFEAAIAQLGARRQQGGLAAAEKAELDRLEEGLRSLVAEFRDLSARGAGET